MNNYDRVVLKLSKFIKKRRSWMSFTYGCIHFLGSNVHINEISKERPYHIHFMYSTR